MTESVRVTVAVPSYNEEKAITACLDSIAQQDYSNLEILVVDGGSTDRTREIVEKYAIDDPRVRLVDNPGKTPPAAMNAAARAMTTDYLIRIDAHAWIPPDYVTIAVEHLLTGSWGGVGGLKIGVGFSDQGKAIAAAMGSPFGVGNSTYHHGTAVQSVDHIPFGAYPKSVIEELGGWDETVPVNQDFEFDYRVRRAGYELLFDPKLRIDWECRQSIVALWRQYRRYGRGKARVIRLHPESAAIRHLVAPGLVGLLGLASLVALVRPKWAAAMVAPYVGVVIAGTASISKTVEPRVLKYVPAALVSMHVGQGLGFWEGAAGIAATRKDESKGTVVIPPQ